MVGHYHPCTLLLRKQFHANIHVDISPFLTKTSGERLGSREHLHLRHCDV